MEKKLTMYMNNKIMVQEKIQDVKFILAKNLFKTLTNTYIC